MDVEKCTVCNTKTDEDIYKKDIDICKNCYNVSRKKYNKNTFSRDANNKKKIEVVDSVNNKRKREAVDSVNNNNKTLTIGF